jgi:hypothetical protein
MVKLMKLKELTEHLEKLEQEKKVSIIVSNNEGFPVYSSNSKSELYSAMSRKIYEEILAMRLKNHQTVKDFIINRTDGCAIVTTVGDDANFLYLWLEFPAAYSLRKVSFFTRNLKMFLSRHLLNNNLFAET